MIKPGTVIIYLTKILKMIDYVTHTLNSAEVSICSPKISRSYYIGKKMHFDTFLKILLIH